MHATRAAPAAATPRPATAALPLRAADPSAPVVCVHRVDDGPFVALLRAYRGSGGLASGDEVAGLLRHHAAQPISRLARWIVDRSVISFVWQSKTFLPLFQFDLADMSLRRSATEVVRELAGAFDDWDLASWFARPNAWLQNAAPVDVLPDDPRAVLQAARADRFLNA